MMPLSRVLIAHAVIACLSLPAGAHHAPEGWAYDNACCGGLDCEPVPEDTIVEPRDGGWFIPETGETVPYNDKRVRQSKDQNFHRCRVRFNDQVSKTRCLYIPLFGG